MAMIAKYYFMAWISLICVICIGCTHTKTSFTTQISQAEILRRYQTIARSDGIDPDEAKWLAWSELAFRDLEHAYQLNQTRVSDYQDNHYLVQFVPIEQKTLQQIVAEEQIAVFIHKNTGSVYFKDKKARDYFHYIELVRFLRED